MVSCSCSRPGVVDRVCGPLKKSECRHAWCVSVLHQQSEVQAPHSTLGGRGTSKEPIQQHHTFGLWANISKPQLAQLDTCDPIHEHPMRLTLFLLPSPLLRQIPASAFSCFHGDVAESADWMASGPNLVRIAQARLPTQRAPKQGWCTAKLWDQLTERGLDKSRMLQHLVPVQRLGLAHTRSQVSQGKVSTQARRKGPGHTSLKHKRSALGSLAHEPICHRNFGTSCPWRRASP